jgi:predicted unusual protein kinase regulating ubiquinone biosynthesis (AarF/ABC1/UbiB family)
MRAWLANVFDPYGDPNDRHVGKVADRKAALLYKHHVQLDVNTLLFWRTLIVLDGTALRLFPDFDLAGTLRDFFQSLHPTTEERVYAAISDPAMQSAQQRLTIDLANFVNAARPASYGLRNTAGVRVNGSSRDPGALNQAIKCLCMAIITVGIYLLVESGRYRTYTAIVGGLVALRYARSWPAWMWRR